MWKVRLTPQGHSRDLSQAIRYRNELSTDERSPHSHLHARSSVNGCCSSGIALVLRNVWVWLHFKLAKGKWTAEPQLFLELLRFNEMLLWITQVVQRLLRADQAPAST